MKQINIEKFNPKNFDSLQKQENPYSLMPNSVSQQLIDPWAYMIWGYLQSLPNDWQINKSQIMAHFKIGGNVYRRTMSLLKKSNLIDYVRSRSKCGEFMNTKILVKNGMDYIHIINDEDSKKDKTTTRLKTDLVDEPNDSVGLEPIHAVKNRPSGYRSAPLAYTSTNTNLNTNTNIETKTTTTPDPDSSRFIMVDILEQFGFTDLHAKQLSYICDCDGTINNSIVNYFEALQNPLFSKKIKNKVSYFMGVMRTVGSFDPVGKRVLTPVEQQVRHRIENNVDNRYGI